MSERRPVLAADGQPYLDEWFPILAPEDPEWEDDTRRLMAAGAIESHPDDADKPLRDRWWRVTPGGVDALAAVETDEAGHLTGVRFEEPSPAFTVLDGQQRPVE